MRNTLISIPALFLGMSWGVHTQAATPASVGIIHIQNAMIGTKDGQKAAKNLQDKFAPMRAKLENKQAEIEAFKTKLNQGSNAMSNDQREKLMRDIDQKTKSLKRDTEDAQAEFEQENNKIMEELGQRIMAVVDKYAKDKGYSLIIDVSAQQTSVLFATPDIDITSEIIKLYDENSPGPAHEPANKAASKPASPVGR